MLYGKRGRLNLRNRAGLLKKHGYAGFIAWSKSLERRVSSATLILENSAGQALIVKANYKTYWTFPGGIVDKDETPKEAAIRETFEEVGIMVVPESVSFVAVIDRKSSVAQTYQFIFKAPLTETMTEHMVLQPSEMADFALVTKLDVPRGKRVYGKVIEHWANDVTGYAEQTFDVTTNG